MFKKIEIWILYLVLILAFVFAIFFGVLVRQELVGSTKLGAVSKTALWLAEVPGKLKQIIVSSSPILVNNRFSGQSGFNGNPNEYESYMLLSRYDGDLEQGVVELVDLRNFETLHVWNPDLDALNSAVPALNEFERLRIDNADSRELMTHPLLTSAGELVFQRDSPLRKIDKCSNLIFQNETDWFHHSLEEDVDGNFWGSTHLYPQTLPEDKVGRDLPQEKGFLDDAIVKVSSDGKILSETSIAQLMIKSGMGNRLNMIGDHGFNYDPIHVNDVQPISSDSRFWKKGDLFISLGHQSMVFLYRPSTNEILWKTDENLYHQHDVNVLDDHRISIFNNNRDFFYDGSDNVVGNNEIVIYDFETNNFYPHLSEAFSREEIRTESQGRGKILPNGDTFVEETDYGRTLMFNQVGDVKWSHVNRASDGMIYRVGWSRLLHTEKDLSLVKELLTESTCESHH